MKSFHFFVLLVLLSICGCQILLPSFPDTINEKLEGSSAKCGDIDRDWNETGDIVVILSLSGGGKRAAAFSYGVLLGLEKIELEFPSGRKTNLLQEVNFISAVSGGATMAAFYTLNKSSPERFHRFTEFLYDDSELALTLRSIYPSNWFTSSAVIEAKYFRDILFDNSTFSDLPKWPFLVIGATDLTRGMQFNFTEAQFRCIGSDIGKYPLSYAVAASAAYPIFFGTIPLKNFNYPPDSSAMSLNREKGRFVNLSDGGLVDNLAIRPYLQLLEKGFLIGNPQGKPRKLSKGLIYIRVDGSAPLTPQFEHSSQSPGLLSRLERAFGVALEQQVQGSLSNLVVRYTDLLDQWGVQYVLFRVGLKEEDVPKEIKERPGFIPTRWTLSDEDIRLLVDAGQKMILSKTREIKKAQALFLEKAP